MCEYCDNLKDTRYEEPNKYQESRYCNISIGLALKRPALLVSDIRTWRDKLPDGAVAFRINYCPECGRKLTEG